MSPVALFCTHSKITIYVVTEAVMPLSKKIKELGLVGSQMNEYYAWGLHRIAKAVSFLNNDCTLVHVNVYLASIVVMQTLEWKLYAFNVLSEFDAGASLGQCYNMNDLLVHNANQWGWLNLTGRQLEGLHLGLLTHGFRLSHL
ncbi:non-receptor serine/threonine protein kinase [Lithospermum erythrorhizon]|uniref:Non-receptor serine/threonine protein kinase n=1 Tax=Lithospermum erythrorhizon TaxID=34254 RepID=A0AAV3RTE6_LITER